MLPEIWRDVPDAQPSIGIAIVKVWLDEFRQRRRKLPLPFARFPEHHRGICRRMKRQSEDQIFIRVQQIRIESDRLAETRDGFVEPPSVSQSFAQVCVGLRIVGLEADRLAIRGHRVVKLVHPLKRDTQVVPAFGKGPRIEGAADEINRFTRSPRLRREHAKKIQCVGIIRLAPEPPGRSVPPHRAAPPGDVRLRRPIAAESPSNLSRQLVIWNVWDIGSAD